MANPANLTPRDLAAKYFPSVPDAAYPDAQAERSDWLGFLDMLCAAMLLYRETGGAQTMAFRCCIGQEQELAETLLPLPPAGFDCRPAFSAVLDGLLRREARTAQTDTATPWSVLLTLLQPDLSGLLGLLCAFAAGYSRKYERLFGTLLGTNPPAGLPTVGLAEDLCLLLSPEESGFSPLLDADSLTGALLWLPSSAPPDCPRLCRTLVLHPRLLAFLCGAEASPGLLEEYAQILPPLQDPGPPLDKPALPQTAALLTRLLEEGHTVLHLQGPAGCGKTFLAHRLAYEAQTAVLSLDCGVLCRLPPRQQRQIALDAARYCLLEGALPLARHIDTPCAEPSDVQALLTLLGSCLPVLLVSSEAEQPDCLPAGLPRYILSVERPDKPAQLALWAQFAAPLRPPLSPSVSLQEVCGRYDLTPAQIRSVLFSASAQCAAQGGTAIGLELLTEAVRASCRTNLGKNAARLSAPFNWADLKLEAKAEQDLRRACDRLRCRGTVNMSYGFDKKLPYGRGMSILLFGPPGTGKTMAAQVIANDLGLDLYRIDLSQIYSKYIGETQKNLSAVFDHARYSNAVLFFDEADALFAKRTDISSSNDRYANTETAFLLQKVEEYPGVTILATNNTQNFDAAFRRRITFQVNLMQPDAALRLEIWNSVFPPEAPLQPGIRFERLAERAELTGSGIKSAAVAAAYAAAAGDGVITLPMLRQAAAEELRKNGRVVEEYELL